MATQIRNITDDTLEVPLLGVRIAPGDVAKVPDEFSEMVFPENYFEVEGDNTGPAREDENADHGSDVTEIYADDAGTTQEGMH